MNIEAKVGVFVATSILLLGATTYYVRTAQTARGKIPYKAYLRHAGGLAPGAAVMFGGIKVGQINAVRPWIEDPTRIEIVFHVQAGTPMNENSIARVGSVSIMSSPVLSISTGSNDARRLGAGQTVRSEEAVSMDEITQRVATLADKAHEMLHQLHTEIPPLIREVHTLAANLNEFAGRQNQKRVENILTELNAVLQRESPKISQITERIATLVEHADSVVLSAKPVVSNLDRTVTNVNGTVDALREPLLRDVAELEQAIQQARSLMASVESLIRANDQEVADTVQNMRGASQDLKELAESLKQRPWSLIRIKQPDDRKVPK